MRRLLALCLGLVALCTTGVLAADRPVWMQATDLLKVTVADVHSGGIVAVRAHVGDIETALAGAKQTIADAADHGTILADGLGETLVAMMAASKGGRGAQAVANPYPLMALYLGSYYNEIGQSGDAVRVLDLGLTLFATGGDLHLGDSYTGLAYERGAALVALKRWPEVLSAYDDLLKMDKLDPAMKARLYRGRGFALTEMGLLLEAEASYQDSLKIEPNNERAQHELAYIEKLKEGGAKEQGGLTPIQPPAKPPSH